MPVLSYVHELFNVDQCHVYIHTLRWKEGVFPFSGQEVKREESLS